MTNLFLQLNYSLNGIPGWWEDVENGIDVFEIRTGTPLPEGEDIEWDSWSTPTTVTPAEGSLIFILQDDITEGDVIQLRVSHDGFQYDNFYQSSFVG